MTHDVCLQGPEIIIHQPDVVLDNMSEWCKEHFSGDDGLTKKVRESSISTEECERRVLDFVRQYTKPGQSPLCGNSIGQDKRFLVNVRFVLVCFSIGMHFLKAVK